MEKDGERQRLPSRMSLFFFNDTATTEIYTLSLHDALPICQGDFAGVVLQLVVLGVRARVAPAADRKSTRLNSSHVRISYAVFCLKKQKKLTRNRIHKQYNVLKRNNWKLGATQ